MKSAARPSRSDARPPGRPCENCGRPAAPEERFCNACELERALFHREERIGYAAAPRAGER